MNRENPEPVDLLHYIHMLIGDGRISFVNVALKSERLQSSVEFTQRHFMNIDVENNYHGVPEAVLQVTRNHPTRMFISEPTYTVTMNEETKYAYVEGQLALRKYMLKTRIPWALAEALRDSPVFVQTQSEEFDGIKHYLLEFKPEKDD